MEHVTLVTTLARIKLAGKDFATYVKESIRALEERACAELALKEMALLGQEGVDVVLLRA